MASASADVVGYVEPGHGAWGKQRWIEHSDDLVDNVPVMVRRLISFG